MFGCKLEKSEMTAGVAFELHCILYYKYILHSLSTCTWPGLMPMAFSGAHTVPRHPRCTPGILVRTGLVGVPLASTLRAGTLSCCLVGCRLHAEAVHVLVVVQFEFPDNSVHCALLSAP